jgi:hypothetical protein
MINPNDYYLICTKAVAAHAAIDQKEIKKRILSSSTAILAAPEYRPGQATQVHDDGYVKWLVTFTEGLSPRGDKKVAFIVRWTRYRDEPGIAREAFAFHRRRR